MTFQTVYQQHRVILSTPSIMSSKSRRRPRVHISRLNIPMSSRLPLVKSCPKTRNTPQMFYLLLFTQQIDTGRTSIMSHSTEGTGAAANCTGSPGVELVLHLACAPGALPLHLTRPQKALQVSGTHHVVNILVVPRVVVRFPKPMIGSIFARWRWLPHRN